MRYRTSTLMTVFVLVIILFHSDSWRRRRRRRGCGAVDCSVSGWGSWSTCSISCGGTGSQIRIRSIVAYASCGGSCNYGLVETQYCYTPACYVGCGAVDCSVSIWGSWSECSISCGGTGGQIRTRSIAGYASCGGSCNYGLSESQLCYAPVCPDDYSGDDSDDDSPPKNNDNDDIVGGFFRFEVIVSTSAVGIVVLVCMCVICYKCIPSNRVSTL
ncbi:spondin-1-like [Glandiceps talaboti]